jgi:localization factor PodJL
MPSAEVPTPSPLKVDPPPENIGPKELRDAAANGDPRAQFEVAAIYTEGRAVTQDYKLASTWYERAAVSGFAPAEYRLGSLYEQGQGVTKDLNQARIWYERAAEAGNRMSMHNLAALYAGGQLGKQQFDLAAKWFEEAAKRGMTDSQFNLGMLYARGLGVPQSMGDSFKWFSIAAKSGDKDSAKARDDVARSLDADTVAKLTQEVEAFKPQTVDLVANYAPIGTWAKSFDPGETIATKDIVLSVQKALNRLGYDIGTPDGIAGKKTSDAIKAFEKATGMSEVGQINPRLLAVLGSQPV